MKEFKVSQYIKKRLPWIVLLCIVLTAAVFVLLSTSQSYTASVVLHYTDENAVNGLTPAGTPLNVDELRSSSVASRVLQNLEMEDDYSVDDLISRINIYEVEEQEDVLLKTSMLEDGQEYTRYPTSYIVTFKASVFEGKEFACAVLDEIVALYVTDYSANYINEAPISNSLAKIYDDNYDYIEIMEIIDDKITQTCTSLYNRNNQTNYYRSTATGMSFLDLVGEFEYLQDVKVSALFSKIFQYQITKNKTILSSDYQNRIADNGIVEAAEQDLVEDTVALMESYVTKMRESGNTNLSFEYILDEVYDREHQNSNGDVLGDGDQTVTYDKLIYAWFDHNETMKHAVIDSAYCSYVLGTFNSCTGACKKIGTTPECASSALTCTALSNAKYAELEAEVVSEIQTLVDELAELYTITTKTNDEYNEYLGAQNISILSTVSCTESVNVLLYTVIAAIFLLVVCCCGAILVGRLEQIVEYIFYTDHMTELKNRSAFDAYLENKNKRLLGDGEICAVLNIKNQAEINRLYGREKGDELLKLIADTLKEVFEDTNASFFYNGNANFIVVASGMDFQTAEQRISYFNQVMEHRKVLAECEVVYEIGLSESSSDSIFQIRNLLSRAYEKRISVQTGAIV